MFKFVAKKFGKKKQKKKQKQTKTAKKPETKKLVWLEGDEKPDTKSTPAPSPTPTPTPAQESAPVAKTPATKPKPNGENPKTAKTDSPERKKLIQDALAIHREKSKVLDNLPPMLRSKLTAMAMAIYIKQRSDNKKN